jgi:hypothetical protein
MKTIKTKELQEKQILAVLKKCDLWKNKLHFSISSLIFFIFLLLIYSVNMFFGVLPMYFITGIIILFLQQTIRSYNYMKFHRVTLSTLRDLHRKVDDVLS